MASRTLPSVARRSELIRNSMTLSAMHWTIFAWKDVTLSGLSAFTRSAYAINTNPGTLLDAFQRDSRLKSCEGNSTKVTLIDTDEHRCLLHSIMTEDLVEFETSLESELGSDSSVDLPSLRKKHSETIKNMPFPITSLHLSPDILQLRLMFVGEFTQ
jgi:hypothetical protein